MRAGARRGETQSRHAPAVDRARPRSRRAPGDLSRAVAHRLLPEGSRRRRGVLRRRSAARAHRRGLARHRHQRRLRRALRRREAPHRAGALVRREARARAPQGLPADVRHLRRRTVLRRRRSFRDLSLGRRHDRRRDLRGPLAPLDAVPLRGRWGDDRARSVRESRPGGRRGWRSRRGARPGARRRRGRRGRRRRPARRPGRARAARPRGPRPPRAPPPCPSASGTPAARDCSRLYSLERSTSPWSGPPSLPASVSAKRCSGPPTGRARPRCTRRS